MSHSIHVGDKVVVVEGGEGVGAVRRVKDDRIMIYVENAGDFIIPASIVVAVHDGKVRIDPATLPETIRVAIEHAHDAEQPGI
jgi:hypothetical protein